VLFIFRSFEEEDYDVSVPLDIRQPPKGIPRRSLVYLLCDTSLYALHYGGSKLAKTAYLMAKDCEASAIEKAKSRNKSTLTPLSIQYLFKQCALELSWTISPVEDCVLDQNGKFIILSIDKSTVSLLLLMKLNRNGSCCNSFPTCGKYGTANHCESE